MFLAGVIWNGSSVKKRILAVNFLSSVFTGCYALQRVRFIGFLADFGLFKLIKKEFFVILRGYGQSS